MSDLAFVPKKKCSDIRGASDLFIYFKQNPKTFISALVFIFATFLMLVFAIAWAIGYKHFTFYAGGILAIILCLYGYFHFKTLLDLKEQVDEYSRNNQKFRKENKLLATQVERLEDTKNDLSQTQHKLRRTIKKQKQNLQKLGSLNENLKTMGTKKKQGISKLHDMSARMCDKWRDQLVKKQKRILNICFERFQFEKGKDGITHEQYINFRRLLPMEYQLKLAKKGQWSVIAGDDGILQYSEFVELMDDFAEEEIHSQFIEAPSDLYPSHSLRKSINMDTIVEEYERKG